VSGYVRVFLTVLVCYLCGYFGLGVVSLIPMVLFVVLSERALERAAFDVGRGAEEMPAGTPYLMTSLAMTGVGGVPAGSALTSGLSRGADVHEFQRVMALKYPDKETVEWLNVILERVWVFHEKALSAMIVSNLEYQLAALKVPGVGSMTFERFSLGKTPPKFMTFKVMPSKAQNRDEFILDLQIKYVSDSNIVLKIQVGGGVISMPVPIQLQDLQLDGVLRLEVSLQGRSPYVNKLKVCFVEQPKLAFTLKPLKGLDLMDVPGLQAAIIRTVDGLIKWAMVWPVKIIVPLDEWYGSGLKEAELNDGNGLVVVTVHEARNLKASDTNGSSDPYVVVQFGEHDKRTTKVVKKNLNPLWHNERFTFRSTGSMEMKKLSFTVMDWEKLKFNTHDVLGSFDIALIDVSNCQDCTLDAWKTLQNVEHGDLHITVQFIPIDLADDVDPEDAAILDGEAALEATGSSGCGRPAGSKPGEGTLQVKVVKASNLVPADSNGKSDPYVTLSVGAFTHKTKVVKKNLNPEWVDEVFLPDILDINAQKLVVKVFDKDVIGKDDPLGDFEFDLSELAKRPNRPTEKTIALENVAHGDVTLELTWMPMHHADVVRAVQRRNTLIAARLNSSSTAPLPQPAGSEEGNKEGRVSPAASGTAAATSAAASPATPATPGGPTPGEVGTPVNRAASLNPAMTPAMARVMESPGTTGTLTPPPRSGGSGGSPAAAAAAGVPAAETPGGYVLGSKGAQKDLLTSSSSVTIGVPTHTRDDHHSKNRMFFTFDVTAVCPAGTKATWQISRRFTQFAHFHERAKAVRPKLVLPDLPDKGRLAKKDEAFYSRRGGELQTYLIRITSQKDIFTIHPDTINFLLEGKEYS
jgi:hypothetical protein